MITTIIVREIRAREGRREGTKTMSNITLPTAPFMSFVAALRMTADVNERLDGSTLPSVMSRFDPEAIVGMAARAVSAMEDAPEMERKLLSEAAQFLLREGVFARANWRQGAVSTALRAVERHPGLKGKDASK